MGFEFDGAKEESNIAKHGVSLARAADLEIAATIADDRKNYGEPRFRSFGFIDGEAYCLAWTYRGGNIRAISLRRAHKKEMDRYVKSQE